MCTAMSITSTQNQVFFGRNMDFSFELNPEVYVVPRKYSWPNSINNYRITNKYKFIATGQNIGKITFADGTNENGLAIAALYFQGFAYFDTEVPRNNSKVSIAAIDIVNFILGNCTDVNDAINSLNNINIIGVKDSITNSVAPLHWIIVDKYGKCITVEKTINGLQIFDNNIKVLANSPGFEWQMINLRNYSQLSTNQIASSEWSNMGITPFGQGAGSFGLPGDYTSPSRFVRTAFQKSFASIQSSNNDALNMCFNIMKGVSIPKGLVLTERETYDYTQYTVFMNISSGDYYFNTHDNNQIFSVSINNTNSSEITSLGKLIQPFNPNPNTI